MPRDLLVCFLLIVLMFLALAVYAEPDSVVHCNDGICTITEAMLAKIVAALEHWYTLAQGKCA